MAAYTVDTLAIEISADSKDAAANIQGLADALANLKSSLRGSTNGMSKLAERLKEIRGAAIGTNQSVTRMSELLNAVTKLKDVKISKSIPDRIKELVTAMSTLKETDIKFSKDDAAAVRRLGGALEGIKGLSISKALPERFGELTKQIGSLTDDEIKKIEKLSMALEHLRGVDLKGFGSVMSETRRKAQEAKRAAEEAKKLSNEKARLEFDTTPIDRSSEKIKNLRRELNALQRKAHRITVKSTGLENAKSQIKELQRELKDVRYGKVHIDSGQLKETQERVIKIREELDKMSVKQKLQIDQSALSKLWSSIKRVAFYRAIRSLLKGVTQAFKEGITNLYQYSQAVGTSFAPAMDRAASSLLYLKNSLGSMIGPIIQSLIPVLETVIDHIASLADWLAQLFAALNGQSTYSRAVKTTTTFAKETGLAAKALERFLAPFDELNVITDPNKSKSGKLAEDFSKMFEEAEIAGNIVEIAEKIKPILEWIGDHVLEIAAGLAAWKIGSSLLSKLGLVEGSLAKIAGMAAISIGITLVWSTINDIKKGLYKNASWEALWKELLGGALFGGGLAAILGVSVGAGALFVTVGAVLAVAISDIIINWDHIKGMYEKGSKGDFAGALLEYMEGDSWTVELQKSVIDGLFGEGAWEEAKKNLKENGNEAFLLPFQIEFSVVDKETGETVKRESVGQWLTRKLADLFGGKVVSKESQFAGINGNINTGFFNLPPELLGNGPNVADIIDSITGRVENASDRAKQSVEKNWGFIGSFIPKTVEEANTLLSNPIKYIVEKVIDSNENANKDTKNKWKAISELIPAAIGTIGRFIQNPLQFIVDKVTGSNQEMSEDSDTVWGTIKRTVKGAWDYLSSNNALSPWDYITSKISEKTQTVQGFLSDQWESAKNKVKSVWDFLSSKEGLSPWTAIVTGVSNATSNAVDFVTKTWDNFKTTITTTWEGIKTTASGIWDSIKKSAIEAFDGLKNAIKTPINGIISFAESLANGFVEAINTAIRALNTINITLPDWLPGIGGEKFGFNLKELQKVKIQRLATGGFPEDGLFFANHNELVGQFSNGRTAVVNNKQIEGGIAMAVNSGNSGVVDALLTIADRIIRAIDDKDTSTYIDGRKITASQTRIARAYGR